MLVGDRLEGRRSEVAGAFLERERRKCRCIGAHKHGGKAMPEGKGFGVQTSGSIGDVKETKRLRNKMNRSLWRGISLTIERRTESLRAYKGVRSCVSALWSRSSNQLRVIVVLTPVVIQGERELSATYMVDHGPTVLRCGRKCE